MSVSGFPYLVDWEQTVSHFKQGNGNFEFLYGHTSDDLIHDWAEPYEPDDWQENWHAAGEASELYTSLREHVNEPTRGKLDLICSSLFWFEYSEVYCDLGKGSDGFALSPVSVAQVCGALRRIDLPSLEPAFEASDHPPPGEGWISRFEELEDYFAMWGRLLEAAASRELGIVLVIS